MTARAVRAYGESGAVSTDHAELAPGKRPRTRRLSPILYLGLTSGAAREGAALHAANLDQGGAEVITPTAGPNDQVRFNGRNYDLTQPVQIAALMAAAQIEGQAEEITTRILTDNKQVRDELGRVMLILAEAERGERLLERVVLSGHSTKVSIYNTGGQGEQIPFDVFKKLQVAFPKAMGQVKHLFLSTCSSGYEFSKYQLMFPNVETIWAYAGTSVPTDGGAIDHLKLWEKQTEGNNVTHLDKGAAKHLRGAAVISTWDRTTGNKVSASEQEVLEIKMQADAGRLAFMDVYMGHREAAGHQDRQLRDYYTALHRLEAMVGKTPLVTAEDMTKYSDTQSVIRVIYWPEVSANFLRVHAELIARVYKAFGLALPTVATLKRKVLWEATVEELKRAAEDRKRVALPPVAEVSKALDLSALAPNSELASQGLKNKDQAIALYNNLEARIGSGDKSAQVREAYAYLKAFLDKAEIPAEYVELRTLFEKLYCVDLETIPANWCSAD